jgi:hypothetical protein
MQHTDNAQRFLRDLNRHDLATLLLHSIYRPVTVEVWFGSSVPGLEILSPLVFTQALEGLPDADKKRLAEAVAATNDAFQGQIPEHIEFASNSVVSPDTVETLVAQLICQRQLLVSVATGGSRIDEVNDYYRARRSRIKQALSVRGMEDPNPYNDLWDWYRYWREHLPSYSDRRHHVRNLYDGLITNLITLPPASVAREATGWERVDRALAKARTQLERSFHTEDFQQVGLLCREVLISLGQAIYDPNIHSSPDGTPPSDTDAHRMIDAYISSVLSGHSNENLRRNVKTALQLALELQHRRTAEFRNAAVCVETISSIVNIVAILSGLRDRDEPPVSTK